MKIHSPLWASFFLSLCVHLLVFMGFSTLKTPSVEREKREVFKIRSLSREEVNRYRQRGVKGGGKSFQLPITKKRLSFSSPLSPPLPPRPNGKSGEQKSKENIFQWPILQEEDLKLIKGNDFSIHFDPPEGVSEGELNSAEKIYYSFQRRIFISYVNSFFRTYKELALQRPGMEESFSSQTHLLSGRIVFDREGNRVSIKIFRSSPSDHIHTLFEETLTKIEKLPNPPKGLIKKNGQLTIYYQMDINK